MATSPRSSSDIDDDFALQLDRKDDVVVRFADPPVVPRKPRQRRSVEANPSKSALSVEVPLSASPEPDLYSRMDDVCGRINALLAQWPLPDAVIPQLQPSRPPPPVLISSADAFPFHDIVPSLSQVVYRRIRLFM